MTSLQSKIEGIGAMLAEINEHSYHYWRSTPKGVTSYIIWAEDAEFNSFFADNHKQSQALEGTIDLFTKTEYDPQADLIQEGLENLGVAWSINSVQYEEETEFIHHEWTWRVR